MRRRSQRSRYTWMPMLGTNRGGGYQSNAIDIFIRPTPDKADTDSADSQATLVVPLVPDYTPEEDPAHGTDMTLRDYTEGQDWFLRRLVGKLQLAASCTNTTQTQTGTWPAVLVTAGFFVARAKDGDTGIDLTVPEYDVQAVTNIRQPWLWRRSWTLGVAQVGVDSESTLPQFSTLYPNATVEYGSVADGPHIDAKTMRRVLREQRLWFTVSCMGTGLPGTTAVDGQQGVVFGTLDVRALGQMRRSKNRSAF